VGDPRSAGRPHDGLQGGHQTAGRHDAVDLPSPAHVHVGFPVGHDEEGFALQFRSHVFAEAFRRPEGFGRLTQAGLFLGGGFGVGQVSGEPRGFFRDGSEENLLRRRCRRWGLPGAELLHPFRHLRDGPDQTPLHDKQGDQRDEHHLDDDAQERVAPKDRDLGLYERRVVEQDQCAGIFVLDVQGARVDIKMLVTRRVERVVVGVVGHHIGDHGRRRHEGSSQTVGDGHLLLLRVVDGDPHQSFPVAEPFHQPL